MAGKADSARRARAHKRAAFPKDHDLTVSDGTRIAYTVRGDGPGMPVVFVNGWSCTDGYWTTIGDPVKAILTLVDGSEREIPFFRHGSDSRHRQP